MDKYREIIFRGKSEDTGEWVYGSFIPDLLEVFQNGSDGWLGDWGFIKPFEEINGSRHMIQVIRETVGQYTGLKDKNGKRIFEGDIVKGIFNYEEIMGAIKYSTEASFYIDRNDTQGIYLNNAEYWIEVVGNIFDS